MLLPLPLPLPLSVLLGLEESLGTLPEEDHVHQRSAPNGQDNVRIPAPAARSSMVRWHCGVRLCSRR